MDDDREETEALRRRLYQPEASAHDLATYLHVATEHDPTEPPLPEARTPHRTPAIPVLAAVTVLVGAALVGGGLLAGSLRPPLPTPVATLAAAPTPARVVDGGARPFASGTATREAEDRWLYTVALGDRPRAIAERFGICTAAVLIALPYGVDAADVPPGMQLQLSRTAGGASSSC